MEKDVNDEKLKLGLGSSSSSESSNESSRHDEDDQIGDLREKFHNTVRENIVSQLWL